MNVIALADHCGTLGQQVVLSDNWVIMFALDWFGFLRNQRHLVVSHLACG